MSVRVFAAVTPPRDVREELRTWLGPLHAAAGADQLRWSDPAGWHCTLAFYGAVPYHRLTDLIARLRRAAARRSPLELRISGGGRFGDRVLWAGFTGDRPALARLADGARAAGRKAGAPADAAHGFNPHLTLARGGQRGEIPLVPYVERLRDFGGSTWRVREVVLIQSQPPRSGVPGERPRYEELAVCPLGGGATVEG